MLLDQHDEACLVLNIVLEADNLTHIGISFGPTGALALSDDLFCILSHFKFSISSQRADLDCVRAYNGNDAVVLMNVGNFSHFYFVIKFVLAALFEEHTTHVSLFEADSVFPLPLVIRCNLKLIAILVILCCFGDHLPSFIVLIREDILGHVVDADHVPMRH